MKSMKQITLPVVIGANCLTEDQKKERISTTGVQIKIMLNNKTLTDIHKETGTKVNISNIKYQDNCILLYCCQESNLENNNVAIPIRLNTSSSKGQKYIVCPFSLSISKKEEKQGLSLHLSKNIMDFIVIPVPNAKFVKNQKLEKMLNVKQNRWGFLSMDQSQRIIVESQKTSFPIIGFWINNQNIINHPKNLSMLTEYVLAKYNNKCKFIHEKRTFFYFMKVNYQKKVPELHLVEPIIYQDQQISIAIPKINIFNQEEIVLSSAETSSLQFTLRSDEKLPEHLANITCSPIKYKNQGMNFLQNSQSCIPTPESPRFKMGFTHLHDKENHSLKKLVKHQQIQINYLKAEVLRLNHELKRYKKENKYLNDSSLTSFKSKAEKQEQNRRNYLSLGKYTKKLNQSDLNIQNLSTEPSNKLDSYGSSVQVQKNEAVTVGQCLDVWQRYELIQH